MLKPKYIKAKANWNIKMFKSVLPPKYSIDLIIPSIIRYKNAKYKRTIKIQPTIEFLID